MIRLKNLRVDITNNIDLVDIICSKLKVKREDIIDYNIHKKSIDARNKMLFSYVYEIDIRLREEKVFLNNTKLKNISIVSDEEYIYPKMGDGKLKFRPIVVGMGPAGLFASYFLAQCGYRPIIFERGKCVEERIISIEKFWQEGILDSESNVQYGEGGAGTFSDGKLNTLVKDKENRMKKIFEIFVECGAKEEIMYDNHPHIGTDILRKVIINMRNRITSYGGEIYYNSKMEDIIINDGKVQGIVVNGEVYKTDVLVLAIGHSARDTFNRLFDLGFFLEAKPFAVGVRIMHSQTLIDKNQYPINYPFLPPAAYKLTYQCKSTNRGVYSFCMCPGGYVVNATSSKDSVVVNGMSNYKRDSNIANSAIVVTVGPSDFGTHPLDGLKFLERIESRAYSLGKGKIIAQNFGDYENNIVSKKIDSNNIAVKGKYISGNINEIFPNYINASLKEGINYFGTKINGFNNKEVVIMAPESRTSSPIRIKRDENLECNIKGIYPCGEGSGYSGGITTSAIDGVKVFEKIIVKYSNKTIAILK